MADPNGTLSPCDNYPNVSVSATSCQPTGCLPLGIGSRRCKLDRVRAKKFQGLPPSCSLQKQNIRLTLNDGSFDSERGDLRHAQTVRIRAIIFTIYGKYLCLNKTLKWICSLTKNPTILLNKIPLLSNQFFPQFFSKILKCQTAFFVHQFTHSGVVSLCCKSARNTES